MYVVEKISFSLMKVSLLSILNDDRGDKNFINGIGASLKFSFLKGLLTTLTMYSKMLKANCFHNKYNTLLEMVLQ